MYINLPVVPLIIRTVDIARIVVNIVVTTGMITLLKPSTIF